MSDKNLDLVQGGPTVIGLRHTSVGAIANGNAYFMQTCRVGNEDRLALEAGLGRTCFNHWRGRRMPGQQ